MKLILYYLALLVFIAIVTGFLISQSSAEATMNMTQVLWVCVLLGGYTVAMSLIGEGKTEDEREQHHRFVANRWALIAGTATLSIGIIYQLMIDHSLNYWLLIGLIAINITKIVSLIYLNYKK